MLRVVTIFGAESVQCSRLATTYSTSATDYSCAFILPAGPLAMDEVQKEQDAFITLLSTFELDQQVVSVTDLSDGAALLAVLQVV